MNRNLRRVLSCVLCATGLFLFTPRAAAQSGVYVLDATANTTVDFSGNVEMLASTLYVNSSNPEAITLSGTNVVVTTNVTNVVGGVLDPDLGLTGTINIGTAPVADPLASLPVPVFDPVNDLGTLSMSGGSMTLSPGYYSGGFTLSADADLFLEPGVYVLDGAGLVVSGSAGIKGKGVTLYFTGSGHLTLSGNSIVDLAPSDRGVYRDVLYFFDRTNTNPVSLSGGSNIKMHGKMYFPASSVAISGESGVTNTAFGWLLVCNELSMSGGGVISFNRLPNGEGAFD